MPTSSPQMYVAQFLHAAARMGSGSLMGAMGSLGSGQLAEGLGLAGVGLGSSSALNIAALNPAGSGRLPDLAPLNTTSSGRRVPSVSCTGKRKRTVIAGSLGSGDGPFAASRADLDPLLLQRRQELVSSAKTSSRGHMRMLCRCQQSVNSRGSCCF